ncbi:MAG: hypothetical protein IIA67_09295 [Planctomycetes bacterium]|nr:hypothetical protein [Planctomycetota bacterium]
MLAGAMLCFATEGPAAELRASPASVVLEGPEAAQQVLVSRFIAKGNSVDLSRSVRYQVVPPTIATVDQRGLLRPLAEGRGELVVQHDNMRLAVPIEVRALKNPRPVSFRYEIMPILTKAGCNAGGCHGKAEGQNGFKLSIFGFDPRGDHQALVMEGRGRRVSLAIPDRSLLFLKASARLPHGGGQKIDPGSYRDRRLLRWIAEGAQFDSTGDETARIVGIEIEPRRQTLLAGQSQQLRVTAIDAGGKRHGVTTEAEYQSNAQSIAAGPS